MTTDELQDCDGEARIAPSACEITMIPAWNGLVGPIYPPSQSGNRFILTISDYFTKFGWAKALATKEAGNVGAALCEVGFIKIVTRINNLAFAVYM